MCVLNKMDMISVNICKFSNIVLSKTKKIQKIRYPLGSENCSSIRSVRTKDEREVSSTNTIQDTKVDMYSKKIQYT